MMYAEDGRLLKLINTSRGGRHQLHPVVVEVLHVFSQPVVHIHIYDAAAAAAGRRHSRHGEWNDGRRDNAVEPPAPPETVLVVASRTDIALLPLQRCHAQTSCRQAADVTFSLSELWFSGHNHGPWTV